MLELGLMKQIERFGAVSGQEQLVADMKKILRQIGESREKTGTLANSELWVYSIRNGLMVPAAFGAEKGSVTESNAVQLWSTIFPAVLLQESRLDGEVYE